jgi:hypothetical protein
MCSGAPESLLPPLPLPFQLKSKPLLDFNQPAARHGHWWPLLPGRRSPSVLCPLQIEFEALCTSFRTYSRSAPSILALALSPSSLPPPGHCRQSRLSVGGEVSGLRCAFLSSCTTLTRASLWPRAAPSPEQVAPEAPPPVVFRLHPPSSISLCDVFPPPLFRRRVSVW